MVFVAISSLEMPFSFVYFNWSDLFFYFVIRVNTTAASLKCLRCQGTWKLTSVMNAVLRVLLGINRFNLKTLLHFLR